MKGQSISSSVSEKRIHQPRKTKALFNWLAKVTGVDAVWIEGTDHQDKPIWALAKRLSQTCWYVVSRRFKAAAGLAVLVGTLLLLPTNSLQAQTGIDFDKLTGTNGFTLEGVNRNEKSGRAVASGDINGDTYNDLIIGASGKTYVVFGQGSFTSTFELSSLDGNTGFLLSGGGEAVASGDINGDGKDDMIIGDGGRTYVVFGQDSFTSTLELSSLDGSTGFVLLGSREAVASGDINGDGKDDVIIGAPDADPNGKNNAGETYVVFGFDDTAIDTLELSSVDGSTGFRLHGVDSGDRSGDAVSSGDINGDGTDDVIIGSHIANSLAGETYVVFGFNDTARDTVELTSLDGSTGFVIKGAIADELSGEAVSSGDINGDGKDDVIIGAFQADPNGIINAGETYVVFGFNDTATDTVEISSLDGSTGFVIKGAKQGDISGDSVSSGDINNDGYVDVIIGGEFGNSLRGKSYVVFGFDDKAIGTVELSSLDGSTGFALNGVLDFGRSGIAVGSGDINGDGADDVIIGGDTALEGRTYVFTQFPVTAKLEGSEGLRMLAAPASGTILDEFLEPFWTQGMTGSDYPNVTGGFSNLWVWDETLDTDGHWVPVSDISSQSVDRGQGFLMYVFSDDDYDGTPDGFPKMLNTINIYNSAVVDTGTVTPVNDLEDGRFFLVGNPYPSTFDWDSTSITKTNLSDAIYIYDHAIGAWRCWNGVDGNIARGRIAPLQSFFVQAYGGAGTLSIGDEAQTDSSGTFLKQLPTREPRVLSIQADAGDRKAEAWLSFQEGGQPERDKHDALFLEPFAREFLKLGTILDSDEVLQINALPVDQQKELVIPFALSGTLEATHATLTFEGLEAFEGWEFSLRDTHTGKEFSIGSTSLELEIEPIRAKLHKPLLPTPIPTKAKAADSRYQLLVTPPPSVHNELQTGIPLTTELLQNYPNPFNPATTINYQLPEQSLVRLEVFDLMGRKIASLVNEPQTPGRYAVRFDASALASGMYFYRLQTGNKILTKKLTLIK